MDKADKLRRWCNSKYLNISFLHVMFNTNIRYTLKIITVKSLMRNRRDASMLGLDVDFLDKKVIVDILFFKMTFNF